MEKVCKLATKLGVESIKDLPGCWEHQINEDWRLAVNGHKETIEVNSMDILPYNCLVMCKDMPVGAFTPLAGSFVDGFEDEFIDVLDRALKEQP